MKIFTAWVFSTENWNRPETEVKDLLGLLAKQIDHRAQSLHKQNIKLLHLGSPDKLSKGLERKVEAAIELTRNNTGLTLCLAFNYGGRDEIVQAVRHIISTNVPGGEVDEALFSQYLYTNSIPDPDLLIRTGGEVRLSNFLLWQAAYSELYFTSVLWPDFGQEDIERALSEYRCRQRRFGSI